MKRNSRNSTWYIVTAVLAVMLLAGCKDATIPSSSDPVAGNEAAPESTFSEEMVQEAIQAAEAYKTKEYSVTASEDMLSDDSILARTKEMKPYFTEHFSEKALRTRYTVVPFHAAHIRNTSLHPENLSFSISAREENMIDLIYEVDLVLGDDVSSDSERVPMQGTLTLSYEEGKWLVQEDHFDSVAFNDLISK
ncbi:hypothetical protein [Paenibacillus sp. FSL K6-1230]|uniref:hypothetical protein n=1 Tax=Paenibacillus sp. FSL K6-1230 TaxID=2921603 RepID=UPI0030F8EF26